MVGELFPDASSIRGEEHRLALSGPLFLSLKAATPHTS